MLELLNGRKRVSKHWFESKDGDDVALDIFKRHYSWHEYKDGRPHILFVGPGQKMVLITDQADALFVWRKFISGDGQLGINCAVFRNESRLTSSSLILEAESVASKRWPGERFYTYVNSKKIKSANPGYCFKMAGWKQCGITKHNKLVILEKP